MCFINISVQSREQAVAADPPSIAALGAVREALYVAEVEADQGVTAGAYQSVLTILAEAKQKAATKAQTNEKGRVNDDGARSEEETTKNERDLGNTTATTSERKRDPTDLTVINEKRRAIEVDRLILRAEVDREVEVQ